MISLPLAHALGSTRNLHWNSLDPPLYETFAFITRRRTSPRPPRCSSGLHGSCSKTYPSRFIHSPETTRVCSGQC